jgi:hypothetical protein
LSDVTHHWPAAGPSQYDYLYDAMHRITEITGPDGTTNVAYSATSQLVSAVQSGAGNRKPNETFAFDAVGNRTASNGGAGSTDYTTGQANRLDTRTAGGVTDSYEFDDEGNMTRRTNSVTGQTTEFTWDHRNRLIAVTSKNSTGAITLTVSFAYDVFDRRIAKTVDTDGAGSADPWLEYFAYDGPHIVLVFFDPDASGPQSSTLRSRLLHGPGIDQVLADEHPQTSGGTRVYWLLTDHAGKRRETCTTDEHGFSCDLLDWEAADLETSLDHADSPFFRPRAAMPDVGEVDFLLSA